MTKIRKSLIGALLCLAVLLIGVCALTACGSKDLTVTFSIEGKQQTVEVVDGKVTFPADPAKEYYEFRGWYTTDTFDEGTEFTKDTEIKESVTVYAYFAPIYVNISVNGSAAEEIKLENLSTKTTEYTADAESKKPHVRRLVHRRELRHELYDAGRRQSLCALSCHRNFR